MVTFFLSKLWVLETSYPCWRTHSYTMTIPRIKGMLSPWCSGWSYGTWSILDGKRGLWVIKLDHTCSRTKLTPMWERITNGLPPVCSQTWGQSHNRICALIQNGTCHLLSAQHSAPTNWDVQLGLPVSLDTEGCSLEPKRVVFIGRSYRHSF